MVLTGVLCELKAISVYIWGVTRHLSHKTRLGSQERDTIIFFIFFKILNDEIYRDKLYFIQLKNTKCKKCRCILKSTYTL